MPHILDKLVGHDFGKGWYFQSIVDMLPQAEMILADNVFSYFFEVSSMADVKGEDVTLDLNFKTHLPNNAPPFPVFFVGTDTFKVQGINAAGVLFVAKDTLDAQHDVFIDAYLPAAGASSRLELKRQGVRWAVYAMPFLIKEDVYHLPVTCVIFGVFEDGGIQNMGFFHDLDYCEDIANRDRCTIEEVQDEMLDLAALTVFPALLTINFMHCRNVEVTEHLPNRKASEKRERKRGHPLIKFRTLRIEPIKKVLREEGQIESNGLGVALHICRGHFKDYRDGKGLFGKHKDMYWWDMQSRGSADLGTVLKDYKMPPVNP